MRLRRAAAEMRGGHRHPPKSADRADRSNTFRFEEINGQIKAKLICFYELPRGHYD